MSIRPHFKLAQFYLSIDSDTDHGRDFLLVSRRDINEPLSALWPKPDDTFRARTGARDANTMLNEVLKWMTRTDAMDQRALHGDKREDYAFSFYRLAGGSTPSYPSRFAYFGLEDFVFADRDVAQANSHDDFMRMIDRDRLGLAMRNALARDLGLRLDEKIPTSWREDIRACGHPDRPQLIAAPPTPVAPPVPAPALSMV